MSVPDPTVRDFPQSVDAPAGGILHRIVRFLLAPLTPRLLNAISLEIGRKRILFLRNLICQQGQGCQIATSVNIISPSLLVLGNNCVINDSVSILAVGKITIGNGVFIAANAALISVTHPTDVEWIGDYPHIGQPIVIEDNVWIGTHAVILPNIRLGRSCIVAAGAVVTKDVPPYAIVAGVPARVIRYKTIPPEGAVHPDS